MGEGGMIDGEAALNHVLLNSVHSQVNECTGKWKSMEKLQTCYCYNGSVFFPLNDNDSLRQMSINHNTTKLKTSLSKYS